MIEGFLLKVQCQPQRVEGMEPPPDWKRSFLSVSKTFSEPTHTAPTKQVPVIKTVIISNHM